LSKEIPDQNNFTNKKKQSCEFPKNGRNRKAILRIPLKTEEIAKLYAEKTEDVSKRGGLKLEPVERSSEERKITNREETCLSGVGAGSQEQ